MTEFINLDWLATFASTVALVTLMVELCKFLIPVNVNPKWYCIGWAALAMLARALWLVPAVTPGDWIMALLNILVVAAAATGTFELSGVKTLERKALEAREAAQNAGGASSDEAGGGEQ